MDESVWLALYADEMLFAGLAVVALLVAWALYAEWCDWRRRNDD